MVKLNGFFLIHRRIFEDPLWLRGTPVQKSLMILCIGKANHEPKQWVWQGEKFEVKKGQFITSLDSLKKELGKGVSIRNIRTALDNLEKYDFLTNKSTKTGRLITVVNYCKYQDKKNKSDKGSDKEVIKTRQRGDKEVTTNNNDNNDNNDNNIIKDIFNFWNSKEIIVHRKLDEATKTKIVVKLKDYTLDEIKDAIHNYDFILKSKEHWFNYRWTLKDFLQRGLEKFKDADVAYDNYLKEKR